MVGILILLIFELTIIFYLADKLEVDEVPVDPLLSYAKMVVVGLAFNLEFQSIVSIVYLICSKEAIKL